MPATNYTPIQLYRTNTASTTAPSAVNLNAGELALNYNDSGMILFAKNTTGNVIKLMNNPANLLYPTADGSPGQFITTNGSGTLSFAAGASLNTPLTVIGNATAGAEIRLPEDTDNGSNYVAIKAPDNIASNATLTAPAVTDTLAVLGTAQTFTALQTFTGSTSVAATKLTNAKEVATVSATAATGTINYDVTTQTVLYYTSNASANWTVNFRGSSGTSLDTLMSTGESITAAFLVTQGSTAYYNSAVQVDGSSVTPKWQGGTAPTAGNASSIDVYAYTIVKTGSAAFTVFASQTQFK